jgi:hypothetical protein
MLDDGTTVGRLVLRAAALDLLPLLEPEDAINATGLVEQLEGGPAVVIEDPGAIVRAGDPQAPAPVAAAGSPMPAPAGAPPARVLTAGLLDGSSAGAGALGFLTLCLLSAVSLGFTVLRRRHARRRLEARIAVRLAALDAPEASGSRPRSVERDPTTFHAA